MTYSSMRDLLNKDFASCSMGQKTSVTEKGLTVSIQPDKNEKITFFHTDCKDARAYLCMPTEETKSCDYLILYYKKSQKSKEELLCFLELKGEHFDQAVNQICNTYKYMTFMRNKALHQQYHHNILWSACVCLHGQAPSPQQERLGREKLKQLFGEGNVRVKHVSHRTYKEVGKFLRDAYNNQKDGSL